MSRALTGHRYDVSGAAHLPAVAAACTEVGLGKPRREGRRAQAVTAVRVEGTELSVYGGAHRRPCDGTLADFGETEELHSRNTADRYGREVRDVAPLLPGRRTEDIVWRVSVPPTAGPAYRKCPRCRSTDRADAYYDWGGGLVWLAVDAGRGRNSAAETLREAVADLAAVMRP